MDGRYGRQTRETEEAKEALLRSEVHAARRLQQIATQLIDARGIEALYEQILDTAMVILQSDLASLQVFYPERGSGGELLLLGHRGFSPEAARRWEWVTPTTLTTCGEALRTRQRVVVTDVRKCDFMAGSEDLDGYLDGGIHAVQTTPLISRSGALLGTVSTHWRDPHELSPSELCALDVLARLASDLIERSRAEEALRQSEERFRGAMNSVADGLYTLDKEGLLTFINPAAEEMFGWTSAELLGRRVHDVIHYKHIDGRPFPSSECAALQVINRGNELRAEQDVFIRRDGSFFPVVYSASPIVNGNGIAGAVVAFRDDTERRRTEEALRQSEERFRRVFEEGPLGVALVGKDDRFLKVNRALCQMMAYSEAELLEMSFLDITHSDDVRADVDCTELLFSREIPFHQMRKRYVKRTGEIIWVNLTRSMIRDHDGCPMYGLCMVEDITEVKRTQEEAVARQTLETVGTLASGIAHDFNNLLGGVLAQAELASAELASGSNAEEELKAIRETVVRGSEIVRQLMIYTGKEVEELSTVDVSRIVQQMIELLKVSVSKHATLAVDLGKDLPPVRSSSGQLRRIIMNLITNASEAIGDRDGVIRVTTRCVTIRAHRSGVTSERVAEGDYLQLEVSDTGLGMSPETQARVFDPFFTTKPAGHGLGLAVVQGIVRSLHGAIHVKSKPGEGTSFQILLPCAETAKKPSGVPIFDTEERPRLSQHATVLVVEDEDPLRHAVSKMLRRAGFTVIEASEGSAALDAIRAHNSAIDVLFLDITLPGAPSREVFAEAQRLRPDIRVIVTSAYSEEVASQTLQDKVERFLRKPYRLTELISLIRRACSSAG